MTGLPIRVLTVIGTLARGGAERQALLTTSALAHVGVDARLLVLAEPHHLLDDQPELAHLSLPSRHGGSFAQQLVALRGAIERFNPDAVLTFLASAHVRMLLVRRLSAAARKARWIAAERGNTRFQMLSQIPLNFALRMASFREADRIVANSASLAANVSAFEPSVGSKLAIVPNIVLPLERTDPATARAELRVRLPDLPDTFPLLGALGSFQEERNYPLLARALPLIVEQHPKTHLVIFGRTAGGIHGDEAARFRAIVAARGVSSHVTLAGEVADARRLLPAFDVVVQPSKLEGSSNALAEAMAAGVAVATTPVADTVSLVGDAAVVSEGWTPTSLAEAALTALKTRSELQHKARRRHEWLLAERSQHAVGLAWLRVISDAAADATRGLR